MTKPTVLSPWYVVIRKDCSDLQYFTSAESETDDVMSYDAEDAMVFLNLRSASRAALAVGGWVRVLTTEEEMREFRP